MRPISANHVALGGLNRQLERFEKAAAVVASLATAPEARSSVDISAAAKEIGASRDAVSSADLGGTLVDLRVSKYLAIANMQVLQTSNTLSRELLDVVSARPR